MAINFNTDPYYDDFDETKGFHRILFRPGYAVQGRELTQMQTIINKQIEKFGNNIFKEGAIVVPGSTFYDKNYKSVKLEDTYDSVSADSLIEDWVGQVITGATTGVTAKVVAATISEDSDPPTLFVRYTNSGSDGETYVFEEEEILSTSGGEEVQVVDTSATGNGEAFSVESGVIYVKGNFVYFADETLIISKYTATTDKIVGFDITEETVDSIADSSLLDPAQGSYNYAAPGANRYKISLALATRDFTDAATDDPNFVELARIQGGKIISTKAATDYNVLQDVMARRTYDESGDYIVRNYGIKLNEHLRANNSPFFINGFYSSDDGGDADKIVCDITPGKAYVKGYEVININNRFVDADKARDYDTVTLGTVALPFGNYIIVDNLNSLPPLGDLPKVTFYNQYTSTVGSSAGTAVGTARVRSIEHYSGDIGTSSAKYKVYLFDIQMTTGYSFTDDAKQVYFNNTGYEDFTADIRPQTTFLTGSVTVDNVANTIVGTGTRFTTQLANTDYLDVNGDRIRVVTITDDQNLVIAHDGTASNTTSSVYSLITSKVEDQDKKSYIFKMPANVIRTVDSDGTSTSYSVRKYHSETLAAGVVTLTAGSDETFSSYSDENYSLIITSGSDDGNVIDLSGKVTRGGSPTGKTVTIDLSGDGYTSETVYIMTTVARTSTAGDKKVKTLNSNSTIDFTTEATAAIPTLKLGKADVYKLKSVKMSANVDFGSSFYSNNSIDITNRYTLNTGQTESYYGIGSVSLKKGETPPNRPIRVTFDYFSHGAGDYFSVDSYADIDYKDIQTVTLNNNEYVLRDCLDFRPRINDAGTGFTGTGSSVGSMPDFENDMITTYDYYLPRKDKIVLDRYGEIKYIKGVSKFNGIEPKTPADSLALFVLEQKPYVFNIKDDVNIIPLEARRYTMKDISKLDQRIKNIEYYTSLSLLEKQAEIFQIKDDEGFDRFKNGFVVDAFKGHGIGDPFNNDYSVAVDPNRFELRPLANANRFKLAEVLDSDVDRTSAGYALTGDLITMDYASEEKFISNQRTSKTNNLNPFEVISYNGKVTLDPAVDNWFEDTEQPEIYKNVDGDYDSFVAQNNGNIYNTVYDSWKTDKEVGYDLYQSRNVTTFVVEEQIDVTRNEDVVLSSSFIPKMRDVQIKIDVEGMKPSTRLYVFMDNINVTRSCKPREDSPSDIWDTPGVSEIYTDASGAASIIFGYVSSIHGMNTGQHTIVVSDSPTNDEDDIETYGQALFEATGESRVVRDEIISTRNGVITSSSSIENRTVNTYSPPPDPPDPEPTPQYGYLDGLYAWAFDRNEVDDGGNDYWTNTAGGGNIDFGAVSVSDGVNPSNVGSYSVGSGYTQAAVDLYEVTVDIIYAGIEQHGADSAAISASRDAVEAAGGDRNDTSAVAAHMAVAAVSAVGSDGNNATGIWADVSANIKSGGGFASTGQSPI